MTKTMIMIVLMSAVPGMSFAADGAGLNGLTARDVASLTRSVEFPAPAVIVNVAPEAELGSLDNGHIDGKNIDTGVKEARRQIANAFYAAQSLTKEDLLAMRQDLHFEIYCLNTAAQMANTYVKTYETGRVFVEGNRLVYGAVRGESYPPIPAIMDEKGEIVFYDEDGLNTTVLVALRKTSKDILIRHLYSTGYEGEKEASSCFGVLKHRL